MDRTAATGQTGGKKVSVICPGCKKKHEIDSDRISRSGKQTARCRSCGHRFSIFPPLYEVTRPAGSDHTDRHSARTIGVSLSKGGVGKTTTAVHLAAGLALGGFRVLLIDTDTQGQDSYMLGIKPEAGLTEFLLEEADEQEAVSKARENLWLLSGGRSLGGVKRLIDRKSFGGELTMTEALRPLQSRYDYIIVDTSPGWDPLTVNVLFFVKEILIPVALEVMALQGLVEFLKSLSSIQKYRKEVSLKYIVPTFLDKRIDSPSAILRKLDELYGEYLCEPIRYNSGFADAPAFGQTLYEFAPGSQGADDYRRLVRKIAGDSDLLK
ncbi:MAG: chromosome partitioning protein ParA [Desulfobacteraceae bacterium]|nr:MAG: chromosome partitioning protein ParA [Desulfobacteraceae bacterium]